jgi:hypothetical protein
MEYNNKDKLEKNKKHSLLSSTIQKILKENQSNNNIQNNISYKKNKNIKNSNNANNNNENLNSKKFFN